MSEISISEIAPVIIEVIESGAEFRLIPKGRSMYPNIIEGEDSVVLAKPESLKVRDAVFYRRQNGQYVLHRIVKIHDGLYDMCGDSQIDIERNLPQSCIIAKMTGIYKKDVYFRTDDKEYANKIKIFCYKKAVKRFLYRVKKRIKRIISNNKTGS